MTLKKMHGKDARAASKYLCVKSRVRLKCMPNLSRKPNNHYITSSYSFYASGYHNTCLRKWMFLHLWELLCPRGWFSLELTFSCFCLMKFALKLSWELFLLLCLQHLFFATFRMSYLILSFYSRPRPRLLILMIKIHHESMNHCMFVTVNTTFLQHLLFENDL